MISPGDDCLPNGEPAPFIARWDRLVSVLIVEPSVKLVARTAGDYGIYDGTGIYPGNERLARQTSLDVDTVRTAWKVLRACGMAVRDSRSQWTGSYRAADEYTLEIPDNWRNLPVYGPRVGRFTCQQCGKVFNPRPKSIPHKDGTIGFMLTGMTFCRPPRTGLSCLDLYIKAIGKPAWQKCDQWKLFRVARDDDWS